MLSPKKKKLAIIGASYLQKPLVLKAKELGFETHVFAWREGNVVEDVCDVFYPISILEKDEILATCKKVGIDGITSIASDLAAITVAYVASKLNLVGNAYETIAISTNKFDMRNALSKAKLPCPKFVSSRKKNYSLDLNNFSYPLIVKPVDRSGSRGVEKIQSKNQLESALINALSVSLNKEVIIEEFIAGKEFSVEFISFKGTHYPLAITKKVTSGPPHFVELEHHQPAPLKPNLIDEVFDITAKSLTALNIKEGASHTEIMITPSNDIFIIEVGGRMGGDLIGSHLVPLSTGYDYLEGVVKNAIGEVFIPKYPLKNEFAGVYYILAKTETITNVIDSSHLYPEIFEAIQIANIGDKTLPITSSDKRAGCVIYNRKSGKLILTNLEKYLKFI